MTTTSSTEPTAATDALPEVVDLVDGEWSPAPLVRRDPTGSPLWIEHASTGQPVQEQVASSPETIECALATAARVHRGGEWTRLGVEERASLLEAMADSLEAEAGEVAVLESVDSGATLATTSMLGFILHASFRLAAEQLRAGVLGRTLTGPDGGTVEVDRLPWGPALLLCPWNAPAPMAAHKAASALAAGCPVVIKPPERAPHGIAAIGRAAVAAGLPAGVVQIVHGGPEVAGPVMSDDRIRCVSFTGGLVGGRAVAHACAEGLKPAQLELGGHGPLVVLDDTPTEQVVSAALALMTTLNGQWCRALGRLLLPSSRHDELLEAVVEGIAGLRIGDPLDPASEMGPIVHSDHLAMLGATVQDMADKGASVLAPATLPDAPGNWMSPTLLTGLDPALTCDEMFGPVASVHSHGGDDEAVELANGTDYGLEAYVLGADTERALGVARRIRAGEVKVNGTSPMNLHLMAPRPAFGLSGLHDEGTVETIEFFSGNRVVGVEPPPF